MGKVWLDTVQIGTFEPHVEGTSGNVLLDSTTVGTFTLGVSGYVYLDATQVGTYLAIAASNLFRRLLIRTEKVSAKSMGGIDPFVTGSWRTGHIRTGVYVALFDEAKERLKKVG